MNNKIYFIIISIFLLIYSYTYFNLKYKYDNYWNIYKEKQKDYILKNSLTFEFKVKNIIKKKHPPVYTQGLIFDVQKDNKKYIYESGGEYGKSTLSKYEYPSFKRLANYLVKKEYFAEGIAIDKLNNILIQLTWREKVVLIYNYPHLEFINSIPLPNEINEGWGLSNSENLDEFYLTDGTNVIYKIKYMNNNEIKIIKKINVTYHNNPIDKLNDLAYSNGSIYCNHYMDHLILKINATTGIIEKYYSFQLLINYELKVGQLNYPLLLLGNVLNGIALNPINNTFIITGKIWDNYYEVELY